MTIAALRREQASIERQIEQLIEGRDDTELSQEDWAAIEKLTTRDAELEKQIEQAHADEQLQAQRRQSLDTYRTNRQSSQGALSIVRNGPVVQVSEPEWKRDTKLGYRSGRDFLYDVMKAGLGYGESEQLRYLKAKPEHVRMMAVAGSDEASGSADPFGGFLIPTAFMPELMTVGMEDDPVSGRTRNIPMSAPRIQIPARVDKTHTNSVTGGLRVYRRAETDTAASSRITFEQIELIAYPLMGISYASEELLQDSAISFAALVSQAFREEFTSEILNERINGTGVGEYLGVLNSPALVAVTRAGANLIDYPDVVAVRSRIWRYNNCIWLANHDTIPQLMTMENAAASDIIWQPSIREDMPDMLLGRPIFFTEYVPALGSQGDLLCVNWAEYLEGTYQPVQGAESMHVRFLNNERTFRFTARNAGQPWWRTALTPKNGANTLSPYVTIAA